MRLFVAVAPPPGVVPDVRDPHVTLCFLGEVRDDVVDEVAGALRAALAGLAPVEAVVDGRHRRLGPTAVVRAVSGLDGLAGAVRAAVGRWAERRDDRPFRGHLTVARRRRGTPVPRPGAGPEARWLVREVLVVRSELGVGPGGTARHTVVATVPLGP